MGPCPNGLGPVPLVMADRDGSCLVVVLHGVAPKLCERWGDSEVFYITMGGGAQIQDVRVPLGAVVAAAGAGSGEEAHFPLLVVKNPHRLLINGKGVPAGALLYNVTGSSTR